MAESPAHPHADPSDPVLWRTEITSRVNTLEGDISEIKSSNAAIVQGQQDMRQAMDGLARDLRSAAAENRKPTQWGTIATFMGVLVASGVGYTTMVATPIKERIVMLSDTQREMVKTLADSQGAFREHEASNRRELDTLWLHAQEAETNNLKIVEKEAYMRGKFEALSEQVQAVDSSGSRKWVDHHSSP